MTQNRFTFHDAFVLSARPFQNHGKLIELFTADAGRVGVVAKGIQRKNSSLASLLQPFSPLRVTWSGRSTLHTLTNVESAGQPHRLIGQTLFCGLYLNELLIYLLHRNVIHEQLFQIYAATIAHLAAENMAEKQENATVLRQIVLRQFECHLLDELGFGIDFETDCTGQPVESHQFYGYDPEQGITPNIEQANLKTGISGKTLRWFHQLRQNSFHHLDNPDHSATETADLQTAREAKWLMRCALAPHLPKALESRKLMTEYQKLSVHKIGEPNLDQT